MLYENDARVVGVDEGELRLEVLALHVAVQLCGGPVRGVGAHLLDRDAKALEETAAAALHEPDLEVEVGGQHVEERLAGAFVVVGAEDRLLELIAEDVR